MWLEWSGLSRFLPSQQEGKMTDARIPLGQILVGNSSVSLESQGMKPSPLPLHLWQMPGKAPVLLRRVGVPASMRKPWHRESARWAREGSGMTDWFKGSDFLVGNGGAEGCHVVDG